MIRATVLLGVFLVTMNMNMNAAKSHGTQTQSQTQTKTRAGTWLRVGMIAGMTTGAMLAVFAEIDVSVIAEEPWFAYIVALAELGMRVAWLWAMARALAVPHLIWRSALFLAVMCTVAFLIVELPVMLTDTDMHDMSIYSDGDMAARVVGYFVWLGLFTMSVFFAASMLVQLKSAVHYSVLVTARDTVWMCACYPVMFWQWIGIALFTSAFIAYEAKNYVWDKKRIERETAMHMGYNQVAAGVYSDVHDAEETMAFVAALSDDD